MLTAESNKIYDDFPARRMELSAAALSLRHCGGIVMVTCQVTRSHGLTRFDMWFVSGIQCPLIHRSRRLTFFSISPGTNPNQCISCSRYRNGSKVIITRRRHCNLIKLGLCFRCDLPDCDEDEWICHVIVITLYAPFLSRLVFHCY
jgi:hypothetical protein